MSRARFRQSTFTDLPRYKKKQKKCHPSSSIQQSTVIIPPPELSDWDDERLDNHFIGHTSEV